MSLARSLSLTLLHNRYPSQSQSLRQSRPKRRASWPPIGRGEGYRCSPLRNEVKLEELQQHEEEEEEEEEDEESNTFWGGAYEGGEALCRVETRDERYSSGCDVEEEEEDEAECDIDRAEYLGGFSLCRVRTRTSDVHDDSYFNYNYDDEDDEGVDEEDEEAEDEDEVEESPELDDSHASDDSDEYDFEGDMDSQYEEDLKGWTGDEEVSIHTGEEVELAEEGEVMAVAVAVTQPRVDKGKGRASVSSSAAEVEVAEAATALKALLFRDPTESSSGDGKTLKSLEVEKGRFEDADEGVVGCV